MTTKIKQISYDEMTDLPKTVYKYRSWTDNFHKEIILEQVVFMARPTSFKDPLDCKLLKRFDLLSEDDICNKYLQDSKKENPTWSRQQHRKFSRDCFKTSPMRSQELIKRMQKEHFIEFDNRFGVLSLTANPKLYSMWYKYSDQHKGFCVGFETKKIFRHLSGGGEVAYYEKLPDILPSDSFEEEHFKQVFSKEAKYKFEEEYRAFRFYKAHATIAERRIELPKECYTEIIFGAYISENHKQEIISTCKNLNINVEYYSEAINGNEIMINKYTN